MNYHNRIALLLVVIFVLLLIIFSIERVLIAQGQLNHLYKPATNLTQPTS